MAFDDETSKEQARERLAKRLERSGSASARSQNVAERDGFSSSIAPRKGSASGLRFTAVAAILGILLLSFLFGSFLRSCSQEPAASPGQSSSPASAQEKPANPAASASAAKRTGGPTAQQEQDEPGVDEEALAYILEDDLVELLRSRAKANADIEWIAAHPNRYADEGYEVQHKILKLAAEEPLATAYVRQWPDKYPAEDQDLSEAATPEKKTGPHNVPLLLQWDQRWAYTVYSSTSFGLTGCCPTALAMVYQGLTGKTDLTPYDMGQLAQEHGYMALYEGTDAYFLLNEAPGLGLSCQELWASAENLTAALEAKQVVVANVGAGDFTTDGHFIVCTGLEDGKVVVNDPYSRVRSDMLWDAQTIAEQTKVFFAFSAA